MRPPSAKPNGRAFWRDSDGFTANDFKTVVTCGTWFACTCWMAWLLMGGDGGASDLHLRFYSNISQVFMVLLGGMAANQFGSMWMSGQQFNDMAGGGGYTPTASPDHEVIEGETP